MNRTKAQKDAIEKIDENILVNAGAGTGKTKVLTERYLEILDKGQLEENREIESIVAITFTKKASQEMKERIRQGIRDRFSEGEKWKRYYRDMSKGNISTIHSFCGNILKENPIEAGIDPLFEIIDDVENDKILKEIVELILLEELETGDEVFKILKVLKEDSIDRLVVEIYRLYLRIKSNGSSIEDVRRLTFDIMDNIEIPKDIDRRIEEDFIFLMEKTRSNSKYNGLKDKAIWVEFLEGEMEKNRRLDILSEFQGFIGTSKGNEERVENLSKNLDIALFERELEIKWAYEKLLDILLKVEEDHGRVKDEKGLLDYNDLECMVNRLLEDRLDIREKYQNTYRYIMVDEFQDSNSLQKSIFYKLSSREKLLDRKNLFVVGDPKQSIYGFRGADLSVFDQVRKDMEKTSSKEIFMDINFRSLGSIIGFVNKVFEGLMEDYIDLNVPEEKQFGKSVELILNENLDYETLPKTNPDRYYEASVIGDRIEELVEEGYEYKDIAILFRSRGNNRIYEDALKGRNIPFYNTGGENLYERQEIKDIYNFLSFIKNSEDRIALVGFLRSPMVGLNDESVYLILTALQDKTWNQGKNGIELENMEEQEKWLKALDTIDILEREKDIYSIEELTSSLIFRTRYREISLLYGDGLQRLANIDKFLKLIEAYERKEDASFDGFIDYMYSLEEYEIEKSQADIQSESSNLVKMMTIHKSKGLQFKVVFVAELSKNIRAEGERFVYNKEAGLGFKFGENTKYYEKVREINTRDDLEELKRIYYVGMTRAEELLVLGYQGRNNGFKKFMEDLDLDHELSYLDYPYKDILVEKNFKALSKDEISLSSNELEIPNLIEFEDYKDKSFNSINISQYMEYNYCEKSFYYKYYMGVDKFIEEKVSESLDRNRVLPSLDRGNIVHSFCELYEGQDKDRLLEDIVTGYGYEYTEKIRLELSGYIENYINFFPRDYDKIYSEEFFYSSMEDIYITGIIDRIYIIGGKAYIYDFKTNELEDREDLIDIYSPQIQLYTHIVERLFKVEVAEASLVFLKDGSIENIDISKKAIEENLKSIKDFVGFIENNRSLEDYSPSENCGSCKYREFCLK